MTWVGETGYAVAVRRLVRQALPAVVHGDDVVALSELLDLLAPKLSRQRPPGHQQQIGPRSGLQVVQAHPVVRPHKATARSVLVQFLFLLLDLDEVGCSSSVGARSRSSPQSVGQMDALLAADK
jgi:hypothetical protein